jgi:predicted enzyme related to lactoylglutathione lyase
MAENVKIVVYPAKDLEASKKVFKAFLGVDAYADSPYYVGYKAENMEVGLDPHGEAVIIYTEVDDINGHLQSLLDAGAQVVQDPKDVGGGMLIAQVKDASGNVVGLRQMPKS